MVAAFSPHLVSELATTTDSRIVLVVLDGLGGLPHPATGKTELETAATPNLDALASRSTVGLSVPVAAGITPGSGPGHLALFGYDPILHDIGRGALSALGLDFPLQADDVAARGNFATVDARGHVTDRRAGRIATELNRQLVERLRRVEVPDVQTFVETESQHRFLVVFRGEYLADQLTDTDPQREGVPPLLAAPQAAAAEPTARLVNAWVAAAQAALRDCHPANAVLLRGFARRPTLPSLGELYKLRPAAVSVYPMYRGLARMAGMEVLPAGDTFADAVRTLRDHYARHDFFFVHYKATDTAGEDGDFPRKVQALEEFDHMLPQIFDLEPQVLVVTGDHSTPSVLKAHSWHPVPFLLASPWALSDDVTVFSERACTRGGLGRFPAMDAMRLMLAHAGKLQKFGA